MRTERGALTSFFQEIKKGGGRHYPQDETAQADAELNEFIHILEQEGVKVRRPEIFDFSQEYCTPDWRSRGWCSASPRDVMLVIGDQIIETPSAWRARYFEIFVYRELLQEYFEKGAKWVSTPKPMLRDSLFDYRYQVPKVGPPQKWVVNESEIVFDAADFVRCGRDIFVARAQTTNDKGIEWLERHLGNDYRIHRVESRSPYPMHIDTTFVPLAPGKLLINPEYVDRNKLPSVVKSWDILEAPPADPTKSPYNSFSSSWLSINVLMLDEERVFVEASQTTLASRLRDWGFKPIFCPFATMANYGGAFHCATLDIRRRGTLQSYF